MIESIGGLNIKRKKNKESPLSKKYKKFLNNENIQMSPKHKTNHVSLNDPELKINVIKKEEKKEKEEKEVKEEK